jgi:hypothetical protein
VQLDAEQDAARHGHGVSSHDGGLFVHIAAGPWEIRWYPGNPGSLWSEDRAGEWITSAPARCGRGMTWKVSPPAADGARPCPHCPLSAAQIAARATRLRG